MHLHQDIEILYVLDGMLEIEYEEETYRLGTDQFMLINTNVRHGYRAVPGVGQGMDGRTTDEILLGSLFIDNQLLTEMFGGEQQFFWCNSAQEQSESYEKMRYFIRQVFNYNQTTEGQGICWPDRSCPGDRPSKSGPSQARSCPRGSPRRCRSS